MEERRVHIEKVCAKYNDKLKYEYRALHDVPSTQIFQNHLGQSKDDFDHTNKYLHCENGAWDQSFMRGLRQRSFYLNYDFNTTEPKLRDLASLNKKDFNEAIKDYNRLVLQIKKSRHQ